MWLTPALYQLLCLFKYRFLNKWNFQPHASSPPPPFFIVVKLHHKTHHPNCILRVQLILLNTLVCITIITAYHHGSFHLYTL